MKFIIVGLGNFGSSVAISLTESGHEVMGVDIDIKRVESLKEKVTHAIAMDATDQDLVRELPLKDTDKVVVAIGENTGANVMSSAILKQQGAKYLVCRAISQTHQAVLEAMQVDEVINPEHESAERWAIKTSVKGVIDSYRVAGPNYVVKLEVPSLMYGRMLEELDLAGKYGIVLLTTLTKRTSNNVIGVPTQDVIIHQAGNKESEFKDNEMMVIYGNIKEIKKMISDFSL